MKVLQVLPTLSAGGAEGFVTNLGVSLGQRGVDVCFFLLAGVREARGHLLYKRLEQAGVEVMGAERRNIRAPMNLVRLARLIHSWGPDIVQANLYSSEVMVAAAKTILIGNDACYVRRLANTKQSGRRFTRVVRLMDRVFQQTIACSSAVAEAYQNFMGSNQNSELFTITNGGVLQVAVTTEGEKRQSCLEFAIPDQAFVVAHIGRMYGGGKGADGGLETGQKAHDVLIRSFAKAFTGDSQCFLLLVGDGPLRPEAEALTKKLGIARQCRFLGQIPEPWPVLKAADIFCFPSRYEGLPNVLPEAASCGLPVVASDILEIRSLYPGDGWLLKPVDDVDSFADGLLTVREDYKTYVSRARDLAQGFREKFSMVVCADKYLQAYEAAIRGKRKVGNRLKPLK